MPPKQFTPKVVESLLVKSHRRCCICHNFTGNKMIIHHIENDGGNEEDNGIPLCLNCHAEVKAYNPEHPIGRKYTPSELKKHRDQWFDIASKISFIQEVAPSSISIDEFPQGSSLFNFVSKVIEKYSILIYGNQINSLIKEKIILSLIFLLSEFPIFYAIYYDKDLLTSQPTLLLITTLFGIIPLSLVGVIEKTRCEVCKNVGSLEYFESKLIKEVSINENTINKTYDVNFKCKACGALLSRIERVKIKSIN